MTARILAAAVAALTLSACATATTGFEPVALSAELARRSHVDVLHMSSDWLRVEEDFADTFTDAVHENLDDCARGPEPLNLRLHVGKVRREDRLGALLNGGGEHELKAVAEFIDPKTKAVVGRYPIHVAVDAGGPVQILLSDRQLMLSDAFAAELCRQAFGRG